MKNKSCALIGAKLGHSYSKIIHDKFNLYDYKLNSIDEKDLDAFLMDLPFDGLNVTIPYKRTVMPYCSQISEDAKRIGCVNTLVKTQNGIEGYNTDYYGFLSMAKRKGISFKDKNVVILGDGGTSLTARTVCKDEGAKSIKIVSRKGEIKFDELEKVCDCEILINTTPVGMYPNNSDFLVTLDSFPNCEAVLDVIYNPLRTSILFEAKEKGLKCSGGLYMLVAQAAKSGEYFSGENISEEKLENVFKSLALEVQNIVLIGMPGCGKSTIGKLLAKKLNRNFIDTDSEIEKRAGISIPKIFEKYGEKHFRKLESEVISDFSKEKNLVIATGGGAVLNSQNMKLLALNGRIYYIKREIEKLSTDGRPLSKSLDELRKMYYSRNPLYATSCDSEVSNDGDINDAVSAIEEEFLNSEI